MTESKLVQKYRAKAMLEAHGDDPEFGYRFLADEADDSDQMMSEWKAWRMCSTNGSFSAFGKKPKRGKGRNSGPPVHDDLVQRDFTATEANALWPACTSEHRTLEGQLYVGAIKDIFPNRIVGYSVDSRRKSSIAVNALSSTGTRLGDVAGCVLHSVR